MAIIITAPSQGSLKINNSAASPQSNYLCNLQTVTVSGDVFNQAVDISNELQQVIVSLPINKITTIAASTPVLGYNLQQAVDSIAALIIN